MPSSALPAASDDCACHARQLRPGAGRRSGRGIPTGQRRGRNQHFRREGLLGREQLLFTIDGGYMATVYINSFAGYETNNNIIGLPLGSLSTASMRQTLSNFSANGFYLNTGLSF